MKTFYDRKSVRIKSVDQANLIWSLSSEKQFSFPFKKDRENLLFFEYSKICQCRIQDFPEGAPTPRGGGYANLFFLIVAKYCMKMKEFGLRGKAHIPGAPWSRHCDMKYMDFWLLIYLLKRLFV